MSGIDGNVIFSAYRQAAHSCQSRTEHLELVKYRTEPTREAGLLYAQLVVRERSSLGRMFRIDCEYDVASGKVRPGALMSLYGGG